MPPVTGDASIGKMIAEARKKVGNEGVITVEEAKTAETELDVVEGMQFDRRYISPYFVTNAETMVAELEYPYILIREKKLSSLLAMLPILEAVVQAGKPLLIIAEDIGLPMIISAWERPSSPRLHTGMPGFALISRASPFSTSVAAAFWAAFSVMPSGKVAAPSSRWAARDSTISCASVSLVEMNLRVVSFVMFASWRFKPGHPAPSPPRPRFGSLANGVDQEVSVGASNAPLPTTLLSCEEKSS